MEIESNIPKIRVCIRKRPLTRKEVAAGEKDIMEVRRPDEVFIRELKLPYQTETGPDQVHRGALLQVRLRLQRGANQRRLVFGRCEADSRVRPEGRKSVLLRLWANRWVY